LTEQLVGQLGYFGIALILVMGGFGLPIPEEAPVLLAAILSRNGQLHGPTAFATCLAGVLIGDFLVYAVGYRYGERVMSLRLTRRLLTKARETQIQGYFHRHGFKILVLGRFAVGFRTAAYLTAGILKLPPLKLLLTDLFAALLSTSLVFLLGYLFAHQIEKGLHDAQQWVAIVIATGVGGWLLYRYYKAHRRAGLPVGPPVLVVDDLPLPPDDLQARPTPPPAVDEPAPPASSSPVADEPAPPASSDAGVEAAGYPPSDSPRESRFESSRESGSPPMSRT
jgi:membrane protein DedA with SNARE-associated domain